MKLCPSCGNTKEQGPGIVTAYTGYYPSGDPCEDEFHEEPKVETGVHWTEHMTSFIFFVLYWTIVFGFVSYFMHELWPHGLWLIPMMCASLWLHRFADARLREKEQDEQH